jgi:site-specific recombinase XerD
MTYPPEPLTREEVLGLMDACSRRAPTGIRDRALICVLWRAQLRVSEALDLKPADFNFQEGTLRVLHGKGDKCRVAVIDQEACSVLALWMQVRKKLGLSGPIFCTLKGDRLTTSQVRQMLPRRGRKAGIEKRVHAHGLRHTGASEMANEGIPVIDIQHQLGHESIATTNRYLHALNPMERGRRLRARSWNCPPVRCA